MMMKRFSMTVGALALVALFTIGAAAQEISVRGQLARTVEAGGWLILTDTDQEPPKYLLLNARKFEKESWFRAGTEVEAAGEVKRDAVTIYQEGIPFEARTLRPAGGQSSGGGGDASAGKRPTRVSVSGEAIVAAQPDTAILNISVVTQNKNALEAQGENATRSDAVIRAVKAAAGAGAEVKTSGYVLTPQRVYRENQPPTITGYEVRNSVTVTMSDLTRVGAVIDAAAGAGANDVDNVTFSLRKDRQARGEALSEATRAAIAKAQVLAQALGGRVTRVVEVREGGPPPRPLYAEARADMRVAQATPIEVGTLDIRSEVQLVAEIE
ncbi:MAG TPA: SIMPL domain-containing protein [Pyrinomonadaceae bacterium]|nr:SIMPL domain-containing protein [Pyrinomonadaceae bacterium]